MQIITKNIRWRALMETNQTAKFDRCPNNLSQVIVLMDRWPEQKKKKKKKSKNSRSAFACNLMNSIQTAWDQWGWVSKMHQESPNTVRPFTRCSLAALHCGNYMRSVR